LPSYSFSIGKGFDIHYHYERNKDLTMGIIFKRPERYFALGFGDQMKKSDVWVFEVFEDKVTVEDSFFKEREKPVSDVLLGGTNDVTLLGYQIRPEYVIVKVSRPMVTKDKFDTALKPGVVDMIWAFGGDPSKNFS